MSVSIQSAALVAGLNLRSRARPWARTGSIDIEALAEWAFSVQMVDRFERAGLHAIEAAVCGYEPRGLSADGVGQLMQINNLGCRVDTPGVSITDTVHPAAYALAAVLRGIDGWQLVKGHALAGSRPSEWIPPLHRVRPTIWVKHGKEALVDYQGPGRKGGYCQLIYVWDAPREAWGRAQYQRWWSILEELAWRLSQRALGFVVTPPRAPLEPWLVKAPHPPMGPPGKSRSNGVRQREAGEFFG